MIFVSLTSLKCRARIAKLTVGLALHHFLGREGAANGLTAFREKITDIAASIVSAG